MPRSSGDDRLAKRLHVLQLDPKMSKSEIGRQAGVNVSAVRGILAVFGNADISLGAPAAHKGAGRPKERSARWKRYIFRLFEPSFTTISYPQAPGLYGHPGGEEVL
eukprot:EG_transcript_9876